MVTMSALERDRESWSRKCLQGSWHQGLIKEFFKCVMIKQMPCALKFDKFFEQLYICHGLKDEQEQVN